MGKFILKMKDMTARSDKDLCPSCSHVAQRTDAGGTVRTCGMFSRSAMTVRGRVTDCSDYYPKTLPSLRSMTEIAWDITTDKKSKKVGFISPAERRAKHKDLDVPDWDD